MTEYNDQQIVDAMVVAAEKYLVFDDSDEDIVSAESWETAFSKIGAICTVERESAEFPELKDLYLIRGILRNRLIYVNERYALDLLKESYQAGIDLEVLRELAKNVRSWTAFRENVKNLLNEVG